jgi:6,7-dimethyl-8-ribityllumazine synthase
MNKQITHIYEGRLQAAGMRFAVVCARFNDFFVARLLDAAVDTIVRHGGSADLISVAWVPGAFEIPVVARQLATAGSHDAIIALGMVIQGATTHAQYINSEVAGGLGTIARETGIPVVYGVVTVENLDQATERSGSKAGNRGASAAQTAIEMVDLMRQLKGAPAGSQ